MGSYMEDVEKEPGTRIRVGDILVDGEGGSGRAYE